MSQPNKTDGKKEAPPIKVLSCQLRAARVLGTADSMDGCVIRAFGGLPLSVSMVWMQGTVLDAQLDKNTALLLDETGTFTVQGEDNVTGMSHLVHGKYVMVVGTIKGLSPEPVIRLQKVLNLAEHSAHHKETWKLETKLLQKMLSKWRMERRMTDP